MDPTWGADNGQLETIARNVGTRYAVIAIEGLIGVFMLPFNIHHLGQAAWGLWTLTSSLNTYFTVVDLGYGGSVVRFVAQYRARRDARSLNEIVSTLFVVFSVLAVLAYGGFVAVAFNVTSIFKLTPEQVDTARALLLISGTQVALGLPFGVFGGVMNGFQRYDINNAVTIVTALVVAGVNVAMLTAGFGLVELAMATTSVRLASKFVYRRNAYRVFPGLRVRPSLFRWHRLKEASSFSIYSSMMTWAHRLNFTTDAIVIAAFMSPAAVAMWAVPRRLALAVRSLTNQFNNVLLPVVVDNDTRQRVGQLRTIFVHGTRLSLMGALPLATVLFLLADVLIPAWVGPGFEQSVPVARILAVVIAFRVGAATAGAVLRGANEHRMLALNNLTVAVVNLLLSVWWVQLFGLAGVAFGTLVPVVFGTMIGVWPRACAKVNLGGFQGFRRAVWPAVWPLALMIPVMLAARAALPPGIAGAAIAAAAGLVVYCALALSFAMNARERERYQRKVAQIFRRKPLPAAV